MPFSQNQSVAGKNRPLRKAEWLKCHDKARVMELEWARIWIHTDICVLLDVVCLLGFGVFGPCQRSSNRIPQVETGRDGT